MNHSFISSLSLNRSKGRPVYLQIAQGLTQLIQQGTLKPGYKLPGTRVLAASLKVNRNTLVRALDELLAEGWLVAKDRSGTYVNEHLPLVSGRGLTPAVGAAEEHPFSFFENPELELPVQHSLKMEFNDGIPDPRLSPLNELGREYHRILKKTSPLQLFGYADPAGDLFLRKVLSNQLNQHRGLKTSWENVFISRGSIMGIYLVTATLVQPGDKVVVGELHYKTASLCFTHRGAAVLSVPVDARGINTDRLEELLQHQEIRMLYITSHHHHPTTVTLAPERRLHLYELAKKYRFIILEDDYDFDYHYENRPTLPVASLGHQGLVIYVGSYSKILYPGIRIGFVVAPPKLVQEMCKHRRIVDRQGDHIIERSLATLIQEGVLQRYLRKSKALYKRRKEYFCALLRQEFCSYLDFTEPEGGMAVWVAFKQAYPLNRIAALCREKGLYLADAQAYAPSGRQINSCRMGFASMTEEEIERACQVLKQVLETMEVRR